MVKYILTPYGYRELSFLSRIFHTWNTRRFECKLNLIRAAIILSGAFITLKFLGVGL